MSKFSFKSLSTSVLISSIAFLVSLIAFAALYKNNDQLWAMVWLYAVLPGTWLSAIILLIRDIAKRRSWNQALPVFLLLVPTVFLVIASFSVRFAFHQLFTFRP